MRCLVVLLGIACHREPRAPHWTTPDADLAALATKASYSGVVLIARGNEVQTFRAFGDHLQPTDRWRWASVTKQMTAIMVVQEVARGTLELSAPISRYLPMFSSPNANATVEQLLRHQAGLPNPDDQSGVPPLYQPGSNLDPLAYCAGQVTGPPGGNWTYNNCDYVVAGAILEAINGRSWNELFAERIARPSVASASLSAASDVIGYADGKREPAYAYERFGAAGALVGTVTDLWRIDRALIEGRLVDKTHRELLWNGKPELGYMALGQWVYEVPLRGCGKPVQVVERRGAIGGIGVRNFIVPSRDLVVIAMTNRAETEFGELWSGAGLGFDLVSLACARSEHPN